MRSVSIDLSTFKQFYYFPQFKTFFPVVSAAFPQIVHVKNWKIVEGSAGSFIKRRRRQRERQKKKIIRMTLVKQQLRRCITIFSTLNYLTTKTWNCLISLFVELAWTQVSYFRILFLNLGRFPFVKTGRLDHCLTSHLANEIGFSQEFFSEKPSPSCIMFRIKEKFSLWREWSGRPILTNGKRPKAL